MTQLGARGSSVPAPDSRQPGPPPTPRRTVEPVHTRRRPLVIGLGLALTALGGLGAVWLASSGTGTTAVVAVVREVRAGQVIEREDLVSVQIAAGSALRAVPVGHANDLVGKRSLVRLLPGSLVNADGVADKLVPASGQALVGLSLAAGQRPAVPLDAGDAVEIVYTPGGQDPVSPAGAGTAPVMGVVVSTAGDPDTGKTVVNVTVPVAAAVAVATWGSAGRAAIAVLPAGRD